MSKKNKNQVEQKTGEDLLKEEAVMSPAKMVWTAFKHSKLGMTGFIGFIAIFAIVFIGSCFLPFDAYFTMGVMRNIAPGYGYTKIPKEILDEGIKDMSVGITYSLGISEEGNVYQWGFDSTKDIAFPDDMDEQLEGHKVAQVACGDRHNLLLRDDGKVIGWGSNEFQQCDCPPNVQQKIDESGCKKLGAGDAYSVVLTNDGELFVWGSTLPNRLSMIPPMFQGQIEDYRVGSVNILLLMKDGSLQIIGTRGTEIDTQMPEHLRKPGNEIVGLARTQYSGCVVYEDGSMETWGPKKEHADKYPEMDGKVVDVCCGRQHFTALTDTGHVYSWGPSAYNATDYPESYSKGERVYAGYFNNYVLTDDGHDYEAWGLKGFLFGSDDKGRDLFVRLIHGGKMNLLIAFVAVSISVIIGLIVGLSAGYYGGATDNILMRFSEMIASFPFYPLVITLAAILPPDLSQYARMMMIMLLLGILGWTGIARLIRGQIIAEREKDYITAAKALGLKDKKIITAHILPNVLSIVIVNLTLGFAGMLLTEAGLSFLGFGIVEPIPSWGNMMTSAQSPDVMQFYWWRWVFPGMAVFLTALTVNLIGGAMRDCMDPKAMDR